MGTLRRLVSDSRRPMPPWAVPALIGLLAGALYTRAANPAVGGGNSGEFQVMAHLLGIAHAPSYPLYLLLAKGASLLPLGGDVAWRINIVTAVLAGLAVLLAGLLPLLTWPGSTRVGQPALAAAVAAVATAAMPRLWTLAVEAEVFSLHLVLVLAFWATLATWQTAADQTATRSLLAASLLAGLGLSNHRTFLFIAAGGLLLVLLTRPATLARPRLLLGCAALVALGLSPYLYVLRGLIVPIPYLDPTEVHRLSRGQVWYVLQGNASMEAEGGAIVRRLFQDQTLFAHRAAWLWKQVAAQFGLAGAPVAAAGAAGLVVVAARRPAWLLSALVGAGGAAVFAMAYGKYPDPDRYLLPLEALLALGLGCLAAVGAGGLQRLLGRSPAVARLAGSALGLALGVYWALSLGVLAGSTTFTRGGYVHHTLANIAAVQPDAIICTWWATTWGWWYAQYVDGYRPDVTVIPKGPDDCVRDVLPREFGKRPVYVQALTAGVRRSAFAFFPSRDLWLAAAPRALLTDGALLKGPDERIYLYEAGQRRWIPSLDLFLAHGFSWDQVQLTPEYVLRPLPEGEPLTD